MSEAATLRLDGDLDLAVRDAVAATLDECVERAIEAKVSLVVDTGDVTFIDSSGLSLIARACLRLETAGERLVISNTPTIVRRALELTGLGHLCDDAVAG
ncbi:MAG: STAS domain-containing protein [Acidimicrobiales bacterium]|nr:STAS domain-containing protein [Acidimicrobiales bacterium]